MTKGVLVFACLLAVAAICGAPTVRAETREVALPTAFRPNTLNNIAPSATSPVAFVGSRETDTVFAFDPRNGALLGSVEVGDGPLFVTMFETAERRVLAVTCDGFFGAAGNFVAFIDASNPQQMRLVGVANLPAGYIFLLGYQTLRFVPDGHAVLITGSDENTGKGVLFAFDTETHAEIGRVDVGLAPGSIDVVQTGDRLLVALSLSVAPRGRVTIVDASNLSAMVALRTIKLPKKSGLYNVNNVQLSRDGRVGYVASGDGNAFFSFEVDSGRVLSRLGTGSFPTFIRLFERNGEPRILVISESSALAAVLDVSDPSHPQLVSSNTPNAVFLDVPPSVSADGATAFVASTDQNKVYAFDTVTGTQRYSFGAGERPVGTAIWEGGSVPVLCVVGARSADITLLRADENAFFDLGRFRGTPGAVQFTLYQNPVLSRDGQTVFVASKLTDEVLAIDVQSASVVGRVAVSDQPSQIALAEMAESGARRVVALGADGVLSIVDASDPAHMIVTASIEIETPYTFFLEFANIATTFDGSTAYVADGYQFVYAIDLEGGRIAGTIGTGFIPITVALREDRGRRTLAVLNAQDESTSVAVVDATNPAAMTPISSTPLPKDVMVALNNVPQFSVDGKFVLVGASVSEVLFTIDAQRGGVVGRIADASAVTPAPFAADGAQQFVAINLASAPGSIFKMKATGKPRRTGQIESLDQSFFLVGNEPVVGPDGSTGYVPNFGRGALLAFDPRSGAITGELALGKGPGHIAVDPASGTVVALDVNGSSSRVLVSNLADIGPVKHSSPTANLQPVSPVRRAARRGVATTRAPRPDDASLRQIWNMGDNTLVRSNSVRSAQ